MKFFEYLEGLKKQYANDCIVRKNGTMLLGLGKIPNCKHMLFTPLSKELIDEYLVKAYKNTFPCEYIEFLMYMNGANLCCVRTKTSEFQFAYDLFTIFGLPRLPTSVRAQQQEEPFDIRIEDLSRHDDLPRTWLKCGTYIRDYNFHVTNDIFIDTTTNLVYACPKNTTEVVDSWNSLDECFCSIYRSFDSRQEEYTVLI